MMRQRMLRSFMVVGTGAGVGKTLVTAAIVQSLCRMGVHAVAMTPAPKGMLNDNGTWHSLELEQLASVSAWGLPARALCPQLPYGPDGRRNRETGAAPDRSLEASVDTFQILSTWADVVAVDAGRSGFHGRCIAAADARSLPRFDSTAGPPRAGRRRQGHRHAQSTDGARPVGDRAGPGLARQAGGAASGTTVSHSAQGARLCVMRCRMPLRRRHCAGQARGIPVELRRARGACTGRAGRGWPSCRRQPIPRRSSRSRSDTHRRRPSAPGAQWPGSPAKVPPGFPRPSDA